MQSKLNWKLICRYLQKLQIIRKIEKEIWLSVREYIFFSALTADLVFRSGRSRTIVIFHRRQFSELSYVSSVGAPRSNRRSFRCFRPGKSRDESNARFSRARMRNLIKREQNPTFPSLAERRAETSSRPANAGLILQFYLVTKEREGNSRRRRTRLFLRDTETSETSWPDAASATPFKILNAAGLTATAGPPTKINVPIRGRRARNLAEREDRSCCTERYAPLQTLFRGRFLTVDQTFRFAFIRTSVFSLYFTAASGLIATLNNFPNSN